MAGRKAALVPTLVLVATALVVACAGAQIGPNNPSGGTSLRQATVEGSGSFSPAGLLARNLSFNPGWQSWFGTFAASRSAVSVAYRPSDGRSMLVVARRSGWTW